MRIQTLQIVIASLAALAFVIAVLAVVAFLQLGGGAPQAAPVGIPDPIPSIHTVP